MATLTQVLDALASFVEGLIYPSGAGQPSVAACPVKIYPGWPNPQQLDQDMIEPAQDGQPAFAHVAIWPSAIGRDTSRHPVQREELAAPAATYTLTAAGQTVTVGGAAPSTYVRQNLAVFVNGRPYVVGAAAGETPAQLAAALQALIVADVPGASVLGAALTLPAGARIGALRVGSTGSVIREVGREEKQFWLMVYSSSPQSRAAVADAFDAPLRDVRRLALADGTSAQVAYAGQRDDDMTQKQRVYRRTLLFNLEFAATITEAAPQIVAGEVDSFAADGTPLNTTFS